MNSQKKQEKLSKDIKESKNQKELKESKTEVQESTNQAAKPKINKRKSIDNSKFFSKVVTISADFRITDTNSKNDTNTSSSNSKILKTTATETSTYKNSIKNTPVKKYISNKALNFIRSTTNLKISPDKSETTSGTASTTGLAHNQNQKQDSSKDVLLLGKTSSRNKSKILKSTTQLPIKKPLMQNSSSNTNLTKVSKPSTKKTENLNNRSINTTNINIAFINKENKEKGNKDIFKVLESKLDDLLNTDEVLDDKKKFYVS